MLRWTPRRSLRAPPPPGAGRAKLGTRWWSWLGRLSGGAYDRCGRLLPLWERIHRRRRRVLAARLDDLSVEGPRVFISYSRSETPLVEDLVDGLLLRGVPTFVDFRQLIAGSAWDEQLHRAVLDARTIVMVVSERSIWGSVNVREEIQEAQARGRRIILAIAEPVPLPPVLQDLEWVDLRRGRFAGRVDELAELITSPRRPDRGPPSRGGRPPLIVAAGIAFAALTALLSLPLFWTVALPLVLVPLPMRIMRRRFDYGSARLVLLALTLMGSLIAVGDGHPLAYGLLAALGTLLILRSRPFCRWMEPGAGRARQPLLAWSDGATPAPQTFMVHSAEQDGFFTGPTIDRLVQSGHVYAGRLADGATPVEGCDVVLRFVSRFNDTADLSHDGRTIPILLSDPDDDLPPRLQRTQWVDFRRSGAMRRHLDTAQMSALLHAPHELLARLGVAPPHRNLVLPRGVSALQSAIVLTLTVQPALIAAALLAEDSSAPNEEFGAVQRVAVVVGAVLFVALAARTLDRLRHRLPTRGFGLYPPALAALAWVPVAAFPNVKGDTWLANGLGLAGVPALVIGVVWLLTWRETRIWVPSVRELGDEPEGLVQALRSALGRGWRAVTAAVDDAAGRPVWRRRRFRRLLREGLREQRTIELSAPPMVISLTDPQPRAWTPAATERVER